MKTSKIRPPMGGVGKATLRAASEAELARNVGILRARQRTEVDRLRQSLAVWIEENTQAANDVAVSIAMLENAFDRYIDLHGAAEAFDLIESAFRRRAEIFRRSSLQ